VWLAGLKNEEAAASISSEGRELRNYKMSRPSHFSFLPGLLTIFCTGSVFLHLFHKRGARRHGRNLKAAYAAKFEERAWIARSLNENLIQAIVRSESIVNAMSLGPREIL
jgi:hypothetical protein